MAFLDAVATKLQNLSLIRRTRSRSMQVGGTLPRASGARQQEN